jgi:hypothetical protein
MAEKFGSIGSRVPAVPIPNSIMGGRQAFRAVE